MRYAIYILVVEDTEENDMTLVDTPAEEVERIGGDLTISQVHDWVDSAKRVPV